MLEIKTKADLQRLVDEQLQESLTLDYKGSPALAKDSKSRDELCKDVSAFANSAGGQIIYGVVEQEQKPVRVDGGADKSITREWIEQVLDSNVQPKVDGLVITPIQLDDGFGYVLTIPQATSRAPHQAPDKRYYRRYNFQSVAMADYEIRDILRRVSTPEPYVRFHFAAGAEAEVQQSADSDESKQLVLNLSIGNKSNEPAFYALVTIFVDERIRVHSFAEFKKNERIAELNDGRKVASWNNKLGIPGHFPIFRETRWSLGSLNFAIPDHIATQDLALAIGYDIKIPGRAVQIFGDLKLKNMLLTLSDSLTENV